MHLNRALVDSTNTLSDCIERLTTACRINHAKDDAANFSIVTDLQTKLSSLDVVEDNISIGKDLLSTAEGSLNQVIDLLSRIRNLALQACNEVYNSDSLSAIQEEINSCVDQITKPQVNLMV